MSKARSEERRARLAGALRENLKRRKTRDRALAESRPAVEPLTEKKPPQTDELRPTPAAKRD